ncbi:MAG: Ig-like domain-containing protein, partial [Actinomycetota bacterium]|nr:Ig-like domain-containing protein [Actinomycetota bacterium]
MKKLTILAGALLAFATFTQAAQAEPENPIVRGAIQVHIVGQGQVTGTGIDCPSDCAQNESWSELELPPTNRLTANSNVAGWAFASWQGCAPVNGQPARCDAIYGNIDVGQTEVTARFADVAAPVATITAPANGTVTRQTLNADVTATDNDRVSRVTYFVDGTEVLTRNAAPWGASLDVSGWAEGDHTVVARAYDPAGNSGATAARTFRVDKTAPSVEFTNPAAATNAAQPSFAFTTASNDLNRAFCSITPAGQAAIWESCSPEVWYSKDAPAHGTWKFEVRAIDHPGNEAEYVHEFVVDRDAPVMTFSSGPADGATVETGDVTYGWSTTDGLAVTQ